LPAVPRKVQNPRQAWCCRGFFCGAESARHFAPTCLAGAGAVAQRLREAKKRLKFTSRCADNRNDNQSCFLDVAGSKFLSLKNSSLQVTWLD
jgi:hypothetical protein